MLALRRRRVLHLTAGALAAGLALTGCSSGPVAAGQTPAPGVALRHVHGLGINPADGALYAGTHEGLVRVASDGRLTRIGDRVQDLMGFTVLGRNHFLASGHPGAGQSGPSNMGLIETTDGGQTWRTLSLAGKADFHALDAAPGVVVGVDQGRLLVSADGHAWNDLGAAVVADLALDPTHPERMLATTDLGPELSDDGGRSFTRLADAPLLQLVAYSPDGGSIIGVSPDGGVYSSTDGARTWQQRGQADGPPEALAVNGATIDVAIQGAIVSSTDGGAHFVDLYRGS